jgi:hypothetical protein
VFFRKKTLPQESSRPSPGSNALFAEIMAFEKKERKPSAENVTAQPAVSRKVDPGTVETKQSSLEAFPQSRKGATIYYEKNGANAEAYYPSRTFAVAKARILLNSGFSVHVVDSEGRRFLPEELDGLLTFEDPPAADQTRLSLAESKIDAVLDVLNGILSDTYTRR